MVYLSRKSKKAVMFFLQIPPFFHGCLPGIISISSELIIIKDGSFLIFAEKYVLRITAPEQVKTVNGLSGNGLTSYLFYLC
jgi:hypothetical protein